MKVTMTMYKVIRTTVARGISLLEALLILIIIAVMALSVVTYVRQAQRQTQITAFMSEFRALIEAAQAYNNAHGSFEGITIDDIVTMHTIVPRYNVVTIYQGNSSSSARLIDPWTGLSADVTGEPSAIGIAPTNANNTQVLISLYELPYFACQQVLEQVSAFTTVLDAQGAPVTGSLSLFCVNAATNPSGNNTLGVTVQLRYPKDEVM